MQNVDIFSQFTYQEKFVLKGNTLEKMVYFDFYNGEWVGYLCTNTGKKVCMLTSASKIYIDEELAAFDTIDENAA